MRRFLTAYLAAAVTMVAIDAVWLSTAYEPLYKPHMGHLLRPDLVVWAAVLFYLIYLAGLVGLAVRPADKDRSSWGAVAGRGALYGLCAYATYDLTNMATLKDFPVIVVIADLIWGTVLSTVVSIASWAAVRRFG